MHRLVTAVLLLLAFAARADDLDARVERLAQELRCVVCQSQSVAESSAPLAVDMKRHLREGLAAGRSEQALRDEFVQRYGEQVHSAAHERGDTAAALGYGRRRAGRGAARQRHLCLCARQHRQGPGPLRRAYIAFERFQTGAVAIESAPQTVAFRPALRFWLKLGFISFGGPAGQIAIMHAELVERRRWISEKRFLHALNYCMVLPGPEAQQLAIYIGWLMHRTWGGIVAGALFVLPSLFILIALSWVYLVWGHLPAMAGVFYGLKPAVTALVVHAAHRIGTRVLKNRWMWSIAAAAFIAIFALDAPFPAIVLAAAAIGHFGGRRWPRVFAPGQRPRCPQRGYGPALIDDGHAHAGTCRLHPRADDPCARHRRGALGRRDGRAGAGVWL